MGRALLIIGWMSTVGFIATGVVGFGTEPRLTRNTTSDLPEVIESLARHEVDLLPDQREVEPPVGLVEPDAAFLGFGHPAVVTVAAVLALSRGLQVTGAVDVLAHRVLPSSAGPSSRSRT